MKLDNSKLSAIDTTGSTAYTNLETQLYNVEKTLTVLTNSLNFKGTGAEQYKSFMQENSVNATYVLLQVGKDVKEYIEKIKKRFLEFESNESGKVSSSRVDDVKKSLGNISKAVTSDIDDLASNEEKAAEYISVSPTNTSKLTDGFTTLDTNLETVNKDFKTKDDELSKGAESILTSISKLDTMITNILNNYVTSSGKYNNAKFKELKQEEWYIKGNGSILDNKRKQDPYSYNTAYYSVLEGQMAKGWGKDYYGYIGGSLLKNDGSIIVENGMTKFYSNVKVLSSNVELKLGPFFKGTGEINAAQLQNEFGFGTGGLYLKSKGEVASAKGRVSTLFDTVYLEGKTSAASYTVDLDAYITSDKSEFGFDIDGSGPSTSAEIGFELFHYKATDENGEKVGKNLLAMSVTPEASEGGSLTLKVKEERAYDSFLGDENWDVRTINLKAGAKAFLGINADVTIPYIWPDGFFRWIGRGFK